MSARACTPTAKRLKPVWAPAAALVLAAVAASSAFGQSASEMNPDVGFHISGGIGEEGRAAMRAERKAYNLHLAFAQAGSGEYLSGVTVNIQPAGRKEALGPFEDTGPLLYVKLKPGHYRIQATYQGVTQTQSVDVGAAAVDRVLYWRAKEH